MDKVLLVDAPEALQNLYQNSESLFEGEGFAGETGLVGEEVALVTVVKNNEDEIGSVERSFLTDDVLVVEFLHDFDFLFDIFLEEGLLLNLCLGDYLNREQLLLSF